MSDPEDGQADAGEAGRGGEAALDEEVIEGEDEPGWRDAGEELEYLRARFRSSYQEGAAEGPSREEVIGAFRILGEAFTHVAAGAGNTLKDPEVKQQVKKTTVSAISAISGILVEWGTDLRSRLLEKEESESAPAADAEPVSTDPAADADSDGEDEAADPSPPRA